MQSHATMLLGTSDSCKTVEQYLPHDVLIYRVFEKVSHQTFVVSVSDIDRFLHFFADAAK